MVFQKVFSKKASLFLVAASVFVSFPSGVDALFGNKAAEEAKWLVTESNWGYATGNDGDDLMAAVLSYGMSDDDGRLFFYLMDISGDGAKALSLTLSEAALYPKNYNGGKCGDDGTTDPEDPRCAKLTISGTISQCSSDKCTDTGKKALFAKHPEMEHWPIGHHFKVYEMKMEDLWMIYSYGGGSYITPEQYAQAQPKHHKGGWPPSSTNLRKNTEQLQIVKKDEFPMPDKSDLVARARWIVAHSLWTTVSTTSVRLNGRPWGNVRSMGDGPVPIESTGLPYFYLPTPDPTAIDVNANDQIVLSFSEASMFERLDNESKSCSGLDAMDPLCGRVHLYGTATKIVKTKENGGGNEFQNAVKSLGQRHPLAPWLAKGGAHTGGDYYTITISKIELLDNFGGSVPVSVDDYLSFSPSAVNNIVSEEK